MAAGAAHGAIALWQLDEELAAEDLTEVGRLFFQRPRFELGTTTAGDQPENDALGENFCAHLHGCGCAVLIERLHQAQQDYSALDIGMFGGRHIAHRAIERVGAALAKIAGDSRHDSALRWREAEDLRVGNDVLRMAMVALVVEVFADILHHGSGL